MARTTILQLADRLVPGGLDQYVTERRERGDSWDTIARALEADHAIVVTGQYLRTNYAEDSAA